MMTTTTKVLRARGTTEASLCKVVNFCLGPFASDCFGHTDRRESRARRRVRPEFAPIKSLRSLEHPGAVFSTLISNRMSRR